MAQVWWPKWSWPDFKRMPGWHEQLEAGIHNLERTKWQHAPALRAALVEIDLWLCDRFNLCEQALLRHQERQQAASPENAGPDRATAQAEAAATPENPPSEEV